MNRLDKAKYLIKNIILWTILSLVLNACIVDRTAFQAEADPVSVYLDRGYQSLDIPRDQRLIDMINAEPNDQSLDFSDDVDFLLDQASFDQMLFDQMVFDQQLDGEIGTDFTLIVDQNVNDMMVVPQATPEQQCDGLDNDADEKIDEGIGNPCGGCEPIDSTGCESWVIDLTQDNGSLQTSSLVGLNAKILGFEQFENENARCEHYTIPRGDRSEIGLVQIQNLNQPDSANLALLPNYNNNRARFDYIDTQMRTEFALYQPNDALFVGWGGATQGGLINSPGAIQVLSPANIDAQDDAMLNRILDSYRTDGPNANLIGQPIELRWAPKESGKLSLYVGGSKQLFNRGSYRAIRHYLLNAILNDDGNVSFPSGLISPELDGSAVWSYFQRYLYQWVGLGKNSINIYTGDQRSVRRAVNGNLMQADNPPFDIRSPSPDNPTVDIEQDLLVAWTPLPNQNPIVINLLLYGAQARQIICEVKNPEQAQITIPKQYLSPWPQGNNSLRQLTVRWIKDQYQMNAPDAGGYDDNYSLILQLNP